MNTIKYNLPDLRIERVCLGDMFTIPRMGFTGDDVIMLCRIDMEHAMLISLRDGNRYTDKKFSITNSHVSAEEVKTELENNARYIGQATLTISTDFVRSSYVATNITTSIGPHKTVTEYKSPQYGSARLCEDCGLIWTDYDCYPETCQ